uniref:hypothetical protein n=1 Tax=Pseudonocardia sp. CA-138482 TaxID=3240023 RepID=UPI003F490DF4
MGQRKATKEQIEAEWRRQERAYQLKMANLTFQQIADSPHPADPARTLYSDARSAQRAWMVARDRHAGADDTAAKRREWELRNEMVFRVLWPQIMRADHWAIDRYTRLLAEHVKMMGLARAVPQEMKVITTDALTEAIQEAEAQLAARAAEAAAAGLDLPVDFPETEDLPM